MTFDVVIIGGGAGGLGAAVTLGRARRSVLVIDGGQPRNAPADGVHMFLGSEGKPPAELLATGRAEAEAYGVAFRSGEVVNVRPGFAVELADGSSVQARRLVVATGVVDELPDVPGLAERWGRDVLHCPYCHGYEVRDQKIGVLSYGSFRLHQALLWSQWSPDVTLFLNGQELDEDAVAKLAARKVNIVGGPIARVQVTDDRLTGVALADGTVVACQALAVGTRLHPRVGFLAGLGLTPTELKMGDVVIGEAIAADPTGKTAVPGVWAVGNATTPTAQVISSAAAGVMAGAQINFDLIEEEVAKAMEHTHSHSHAEEKGYGQEWWDAFYADRAKLWSGKANVALVKEAGELTPGTALDLGAGEGGDAVWLAQQGWQVTAVDISKVALDRGAAAAANVGVAERIEWQVRDLFESFPEGQFDLVTTSYLHTHDPRPRDAVLQQAAAAVKPGGTLLVIGHSAAGPGGNPHHVELPGPDDVLASLALNADEWDVLGTEEFTRVRLMDDGEEFTHVDNTVKARRRS